MTGQPRETDVWTASPLDAALAEEARRLVARLDGPQRLWLSGYLAGAALHASPVVTAAVAPGRAEVIILFGSQTGNAERLAKEFASALALRNVACTVLDMLDCKVSHLAQARTLLVVVSTQGEGDPPERAVPLVELLRGRKAPRLDHLTYSVLALGDSSYEKFCETGRQFDAQLAALGAVRLHPRVDCDVDFETPARTWLDAVAGVLGRGHDARAAIDASAAVAAPVSHASGTPATSAYTRKNPFQAELLANVRLTAEGSSKDVRHIELALNGSGIQHEPGDAIGIVPRNDEAEVDALVAALGWSPDAEVPSGAQSSASLQTLRESLLHRHEIRHVSRTFVERYAGATGNEALQSMLIDPDSDHLQRYLRSHAAIDLVREHPPSGLVPGTFVALLPPLAPRLYSIASSALATPGEVHLTVSLVKYDGPGRQRCGVVSGALAGLEADAANVPVYLHRNPAFRLPAADVPIIMVGPGTGIAPFRAFVAERAATGAPGRNWLFFGDRTFEADFLYQSEWLGWRKQGVLTHMNVAFSRDQPQKVYVQHRIREQGAALWAWLQAGAHLYVCGDASQMAGDVHEAFLHIAQSDGGLSEEHAVEYFTGLQRERRYQRDVY
jgi:sulfite reductase (NADPH) flavoprotein alpha-component